ncbi:MAG TPA: RAMP superfamily CRISPR-associated protein, partial [Longimicrobiaceae bacterium]|nr:RAMP superfamily CRISPR-associated protein [Longimicrobiaceae bacterium]
MNDRRFQATIRTTSPLHLGNGETGDAVDLPLNRGPDGRPYISGTAIAGRLRENATRLAPLIGWPACAALQLRGPRAVSCDCPVCRVFGHRFLPREESQGQGSTSLHASRITVFDACTPGGGLGAALIRDGVGISRRRGAAQDGAKYDMEWLSAGAPFEMRIELQADPSPESGPEGVTPARLQELVIALAVSEWCAGRGRIGAAAA